MHIPHLHLPSPNNEGEGEGVHRGHISLLRVKAFLCAQRASISTEGDIVWRREMEMRDMGASLREMQREMGHLLIYMHFLHLPLHLQHPRSAGYVTPLILHRKKIFNLSNI